MGDPVMLQRSIAVDRYYFLMKLNSMSSIKISLRDPASGAWTTWDQFPGKLFTLGAKNSYTKKREGGSLAAAVDVHRSVLENEVVIESDYPEYGDNYEAMKLIGKILEAKGFVPHYYYSGSKSIHCHVFLDFKMFLTLDKSTQTEIIASFKGRSLFVKKFMTWLRDRLITAWGLNLREFDPAFINSSHLVRSELSRNKKGYKTFLGHTHADLSFVPCICNEENRIYPELGELHLSRPHDFAGMVEEFLQAVATKKKLLKARRKEVNLNKWLNPDQREDVRECVKYILSEDFVKNGDGHRRALFVLCNELRRVYGDDLAYTMINDWNLRCGAPLEENTIKWQMEAKEYTLTCDFVHAFLLSVGCSDIEQKCGRKI